MDNGGIGVEDPLSGHDYGRVTEAGLSTFR